MPTGQEIREEIQRRGLVALGATTASGATNYLVDTIRLNYAKLGPQEYGDAWVRFTSGTHDGTVRQLERVDAANGRAYLSPALGSAADSGATYEIWKYGIQPDDVDRARDRALTRRCTRWRPRPLSVLSEVDTWTGTIVGDEVLATTTLDFPHEFTTRSLLVTNTSLGGAKSESYYVQPQARFDVFGIVSVRAGAGTLRVRDITNGADIDLDGESAFTLRGWQRFAVSFEVPDGCGEIQVWPGGAAAAITEWAALGMRPTAGVWMPLAARVKGEGDVGRVWAYDGAGKPAYESTPFEIGGVQRRTAGDGVSLMIPPHIGRYGVYYDEVHRYSALQTQAQYLTVAGRVAGDAAVTDCPLRYVEAATVCELLQHRPIDESEELGRIYNAAVMELEIYGLQDGAQPIVVEEPRDLTGSIPFMR